jgi:hypothetical protein
MGTKNIRQEMDSRGNIKARGVKYNNRANARRSGRRATAAAHLERKKE